MKIVHICASGSYTDYWSYQDNLLPKYQKKLGNEVVVIATVFKHEKNRIIKCLPTSYVLDDGVRVIRLEYKKYFFDKMTMLLSKFELMAILIREKPDVIFHHGLVSFNIFQAIKYKRHNNPKCIIIEDNHQDYNNTPCITLKNKIGRLYYRIINKFANKYVTKVYGVTPWRISFAYEYFKIPKEKLDLLIMGADDEYLDFENRDNIRSQIRKEYGFTDNDFVIVTGGKIDKKKNIHILMEAVGNLPDVKLLVFGEACKDIKANFDRLLEKNKNITYIGWVDSNKIYDYYFASDLAFFPGGHSVVWEQACASKIPCVFKRWDGIEHLNNGGNSDFISDVTVNSITDKICDLKYTPKYYKMKEIAESDKTDVYLYSNIAKKSLECAR